MRGWPCLAAALSLGAVFACGDSRDDVDDGGVGSAPDARAMPVPMGTTPVPDPPPDAAAPPPDAAAPAPDDAGPDANVGGDAGAAFAVRAIVTGLTGLGLAVTIETAAARTVPLATNGTIALGSFGTGTSYQVRIATQPAGQACHVTRGKGNLALTDVTVDVACGPLDLLLNEVSHCHFGSDACWFEVVNPSASAIDLAGYQLRTGAVERDADAPVIPSQTFTLPSLSIAAGGFAVVRGRATEDVIDGPSVVSVLAAGNVIPHWGNGSPLGTGFIELIKAGKTVDFVRFGTSTVPPTTGEWIGANAVGWPSSDQSYQRGISRVRGKADTDSGEDWPVSFFPTAGGPNDITSDVDADGDGIPDQAEVSGGTVAGVDVYAMGARTGRKDVFVEVDHMTSTDPGIVPQRVALDMIVGAFAAHDVALHFDTGNLFAAAFDPSAFNLGGGNAVPFAQLVTLGATAGSENAYAYKAAYFDVRRSNVFHYLLLGNKSPDGSGGLGELRGNDLLVTIGGPFAGAPNGNYAINTQASAIMHELGHNLGLLHGGNDDVNLKPNYISTMNYLYASFGLASVGTKEGDRYYLRRHQTVGGTCGGVSTENDLFRSRSGTQFILDYSNGTSAALVESSLTESSGLGRPGSTAVDFNCDGATTSGYALDLNGDGQLQTLSDFNDWANLDLAFGRYATSQNSLASAQAFDPLRNDCQRVIREHPPTH